MAQGVDEVAGLMGLLSRSVAKDDEFPDDESPEGGMAETPAPGEQAEKSSGRKQKSGSQKRKEARDRQLVAQRTEILTDVEEIVEGWHTKLAARTAPMMPVMSSYIALNTEANIKAVLRVSRGHPQVVAGILRAAEYDAFMDLGAFMVGLVVCMGVESTMLPADGMAARALGVTPIWEEVERERALIFRESGGEEFYAGGAAGQQDAAPNDGASASLPGLLGELGRVSADGVG